MPSIARTTFPSSTPAFEEVVAEGKPVIFEGALAQWKCTRDWSLEYLKKTAGAREIFASVSDNPLFQGDPKTGHYTAAQMAKMTFGAFLDTIAEGQTPGRHLYAHKQDILTGFPELREDIQIPEPIRDRTFLGISLWMGPRGSMTQLHHDFTNNLFAMVRGRKRVTLFDPAQLKSFYRFPFKALNGRSSWHLSLLGDVDHPNPGEYPAFKGAERYEAEMQPGDMLLIPNFWWHQVESLDQPSISLAHWWHAKPWADVEQNMQRITAFAEAYEAMDPAWQRWVEGMLAQDVFRKP